MQIVRALRSYIVLPLFVACARADGPAEQPSQVPTATLEQRSDHAALATLGAAPLLAAAPTLAALQLARLEYAFQAAELVRRDWPAMQPAQTCVMLVEPASQWVLNCERAAAGFVQTGQHFRARPIYVHEGGSFDMGGQTRSTAQLLAATPAAAQVPSAHTAPALPGQNPWLVVGSLEALSQFHPSFPQATTEAWVSVIMHELVHTHQLRAAGSERFLDAIVKLERTPDVLTAHYLNDARYHALVEREYALLTRAARAPASDTHTARRALQRWLTLYEQRARALRDRPQLIADDALFSYLEGVARFVESQFLEDPSLHPAEAPTSDPRFHDYQLFAGRGYAGSPNRQLDQHYFYAIGYHLCVLLDRLDRSWRSRVHSRENFLFDVVREVAAPLK